MRITFIKAVSTRLAFIVFSSFIGTGGLSTGAEEEEAGPVRDLLHRLIPAKEMNFICEKIAPGAKGEQAFELKSRDGKVVLGGTNANAMAVGLNHYLKYYCHTNVSWYAANPVSMPGTLPAIEGTVRKDARCQNRFFLNYCTFGYTMPWWQWNDWERMIDWMALHGVTMPLAITGQEAVWYRVWQKFGLNDEQIRNYFTGPAHLPWHRMANIDYWQGGLPHSWLDQQLELQKRIVARERDFNMTPALPAFAGHVPEAIVTAHPQAKIALLGDWGGFNKKYLCHFLDPLDPLFNRIQKEFLTEQTRLFGTDHIYGCDPFNEVTPPSWEPEYLAKVGKTIYDSMAAVDPQARWLEMTWVFYYDRKHWTNERIKAMVRSVPQDKMILLDYYGEMQEVWKMTGKYFDQPFLWCYLGNFGGNTMLAGNLKTVEERMENTFVNGGPGLTGIGSTLEGFDVNLMMYDYVFEKAWSVGPTDVEEWIRRYAASRCGGEDGNFAEAWQILLNKVFTLPAVLGQGMLANARPTLTGHGNWSTNPAINYDNRDLLRIWDLMLKARDKSSDSYRHDLVNVARQTIGNYFSVVRDRLAAAYEAKDLEKATAAGVEMMQILDDMDMLLSTRSDFMLGKWLKDARLIGGQNAEDVKYYERNARTTLTTWGERGQSLNEYANRSWAGLISGYYRKRWEMFVRDVTAAIRENREFDSKTFHEKMTGFEWQWTQQCDAYPAVPVGDSVPIATGLYQKYQAVISAP